MEDSGRGKISTGELHSILKWREKGLSYGDISDLVKLNFEKDITRQGVKYLCDKYGGEEEEEEIKSAN